VRGASAWLTAGSIVVAMNCSEVMVRLQNINATFNERMLISIFNFIGESTLIIKTQFWFGISARPESLRLSTAIAGGLPALMLRGREPASKVAVAS
jgi:hypothetical protein